MAKIGTAHVEVKTVLNEEALAATTERIETAIREAIRSGMAELDTLMRDVYALHEKRTQSDA